MASVHAIKRELRNLVAETNSTVARVPEARHHRRSEASLSPDSSVSVSSDAELAAIADILSGQSVQDFGLHPWWANAPPAYGASFAAPNRFESVSPLSDELSFYATSPSSSEASVDDALIQKIISDDGADVPSFEDVDITIPRVVDAVCAQYESAMDDNKEEMQHMSSDNNDNSMSDGDGDDSDGPADGSRRGRSGPMKTLRDFLQSLTPEEREGMRQEKIDVPMDTHLTKAEERSLKKLRRKVRNKISAQESRRRKKDYVSGLEQRIEMHNTVNVELKTKVRKLEDDNRTLVKELRKLQSLLTPSSSAGKNAVLGTSMSTGVCLMVVLLSFSVFYAPLQGMQTPIGGGSASVSAGSGRVVDGVGASRAVDGGAHMYRVRTLKQIDDSNAATLQSMTDAPLFPPVVAGAVSKSTTTVVASTNSSQSNEAVDGVAVGMEPNADSAAMDVAADVAMGTAAPAVPSSLKESLRTVGRAIANKAAMLVVGRGAHDGRVAVSYNGGSVVALPE
eukprot:Opistho-2@21775